MSAVVSYVICLFAGSTFYVAVFHCLLHNILAALDFTCLSVHSYIALYISTLCNTQPFSYCSVQPYMVQTVQCSPFIHQFSTVHGSVFNRYVPVFNVRCSSVQCNTLHCYCSVQSYMFHCYITTGCDIQTFIRCSDQIYTLHAVLNLIRTVVA